MNADTCDRCFRPVFPFASDAMRASGQICTCVARVWPSHAPVAQNEDMEPCAPKKPRKTVVARPAEKEEDIQQAIIQALRLKGYDVRQTTVRLRRCPKCGSPPAGHYGSDKGIADLLVWFPHIQGWRMLECKGLKTAVSPEQKQSALDGKMAIARSVEQALKVVEGWMPTAKPQPPAQPRSSQSLE